MKILHCIYDHIKNPWIGGGGAVRAYEIYKRLLLKGHEIQIVSGKYPFAKNYRDENIEFIFVGTEKNLIASTFSYAFFAHQFLKKNYGNYDIIIEDFAPWNPIFSCKFRKNILVVLQLHHRERYNILKRYSIFGIPFFFIEKFYPQKFSNIIVISEKTKEKFGITNAQIISNGINENLLKVDSKTGNYITYIGRIDFYNKGIDVLLNANIPYPLKLAGRGKDENKLKDKIKGKKAINFLGFLNSDEKIDLIKNAKFVVMPSRFEGQGIVAIEAAALGKALLVSNIPELEYVIDNGFGISFQSENSIDLGEKINHLWDNDTLISEMGQKAREFAKNYTWDKIAEEYEKFLINVKEEEKHPS